MPNLGVTEILIILLIVILLFGAAKLPDMARSLGRSMRIFKSEIKEMKKDDEDDGDGAGGEPKQLPQQQYPAQPQQQYPAQPQQQYPAQPQQQYQQQYPAQPQQQYQQLPEPVDGEIVDREDHR